MKALIIAAGAGSRLGRQSAPKPLIPVVGLSIIERVILACRDAGVREFVVVVGYERDTIREALGDGHRWDVRIQYAVNAEWERPNGLSVLVARDLLAGEKKFLLLMSDHLIDPAMIERMKEAPFKPGDCLLAVDRNIAGVFDLEDATKVRCENERITAIHKTLKDYNGIDCGVFLTDSALFEALEEAAQNGDESLSAGNQVLAGRGRMKAVDATGIPWLDVDHPQGLREARRRVLRSLIKPQDGFVSVYLNRPVSLRLTFLLSKTPVTPNQISFATLLLAFAGCAAFLEGQPLLGGVLVHLNSVLDGCDGELARLTRRATFFGGWWDRVLDRIKEYMIFFVLGLRAFAQGHGEAAWIGTILLSFTAAASLTTESAVTASGLLIKENPPRWARVLQKIQTRPESIMLLIALGMMLDAAFPLMILLTGLYALSWIGWSVGGE